MRSRIRTEKNGQRFDGYSRRKEREKNKKQKKKGGENAERKKNTIAEYVTMLQ